MRLSMEPHGNSRRKDLVELRYDEPMTQRLMDDDATTKIRLQRNSDCD